MGGSVVPADMDSSVVAVAVEAVAVAVLKAVVAVLNYVRWP